MTAVFGTAKVAELSAGQARPPVGIIIPAHNEQTGIARCLDALRPQLIPGDSVVVVCNGCTDETADIARGFGDPVRVVELAKASKIAALNVGDTLTDVFPRLYVDGDVALDDGAVAALVAELSVGPVELAAPALRVDTTNASLLVRLYTAIWSRLPSVKDDTTARGVYGLSSLGRSRFEVFPDVTADDHFVRDRISPQHRLVVGSVASTVVSSQTLRGLLKRKTRTVGGNRQLDAASPEGRRRYRRRRRQWVTVVRNDPRLLPVIPLYLLVSVVPRAVVVARRLRGRSAGWDRDDSSR